VRLMIWSPFYLPDKGGTETLLAALLPRMVARDHEVLVVASHGRHSLPDDTTRDGVRVVRFHFKEAVEGNRMGEVVDITRRIAALRKELQPELNHVHCVYSSNFFHLRTARIAPAPTLLTLHNDYIAGGLMPKEGTLFRTLLDQADRVTAVSRGALAPLLRELPDVRERASVIYNGVELGAVRSRPVPFDAPELLVLGRLIPAKGGDLAIEAFRRLGGDCPVAHLTFAGTGPLQSELEQQVAHSGLAGRVRFLGDVPHEEIGGLLESATVLLMPSRVEGLPMALLEALSRECPVIATRVGGIPEVIQDGVTGRVVPPEDPGALEAAIRLALTDAERTREMARAARRKAEEIFDIDEALRKYEAVYAEMVAT
jgi:glycosyltransferase involved in cell wall biosynthesis